MQEPLQHRPGTVYLVGGGPGDPELLTLKAARLIAAADVVAYDDLLNPAVLRLCKTSAELIPVGYRGLRGGTRSGAPGDRVLSPLVIARARQGKLVIRLKCGDPLVFGRGGEEALELKEAGLAWEFVPGISAALGAAAYAGIPLTHRGLSSSVTLATGHLALKAPSPTVVFDRRRLDNGTIVFYMPRYELAAQLDTLVAAGMDPSTPAAFVCAATTRAQRVIEGTVADLAPQVAAFRTGAPGLVIIGRTVALRQQINWFEQGGILAGKRVLMARARSGESKIAVQLRELGAEVVEAPIIQSWPLATPAADEAMVMLEASSCLVFGCSDGVEAFVQRFKDRGLDMRSLAGCHIVAVGEQAGERLRWHGWQPWRQLPGSCEAALAELVPELKAFAHIYLVTGTAGRPKLTASLAASETPVTTLVAYATRSVWPKVVAPPPDLIVLPSSSAARAVLSADIGTPLADVPMVAIGPMTAAAARDLGASQVHMPPRDETALVIAMAVQVLLLGQGPGSSIQDGLGASPA